MHWFKHSTTAMIDQRIKRLIIKYGMEGYGVYFAILETVAMKVTATKQTYVLEEDWDILADMFKMDEARLKEMCRYMIEIGLLEHNGEKVTAKKLGSRLDEYMRKVRGREVKKKDVKIENLAQYHADKIHKVFGKPVNEPDMDAWYLGISDILKAGVPFEDIKETIDTAVKDEFWKSKIMHGGKLRDNYDSIRANLFKQEDKPSQNREERFKNIDL